MAKQRKQEDREITRKEHSLRRKDVEKNRRIVLGLAAVVILLVGLLGAGALQELVLKPRRPIAVVDGTAVSAQDYAKRVRFTWFQENQSGQGIQDPQGTSLQVLDQMIDDQLVREQAKAKGITVSQDEINTEIEQGFGFYRNTPTPAPTNTPAPTPTPGGSPTPTPFPTSTPVSEQAYKDQFSATMKQLSQNAGMTEADYRNLVEVYLMQKKLYDLVSADVPTTEEQIKVRHILVAIRTPEPTPEPTATGQPTAAPTATGQPTAAPTATPLSPRDDAQALARIIEVQQKLGAGGDFAQLAQQYSDDPGTATEGGELGWVGKGAGLDAAFEAAAFALQPGQTSQPVKSSFGYHLIQVEERDPNHPLDSYTLSQRKYDAYTKWLDGVRQAAKIERNWSIDKVPPTPSAPTG